MKFVNAVRDSSKTIDRKYANARPATHHLHRPFYKSDIIRHNCRACKVLCNLNHSVRFRSVWLDSASRRLDRNVKSNLHHRFWFVSLPDDAERENVNTNNAIPIIFGWDAACLGRTSLMKRFRILFIEYLLSRWIAGSARTYHLHSISHRRSWLMGNWDNVYFTLRRMTWSSLGWKWNFNWCRLREDNRVWDSDL